jgi:hypothetical protein
LKNPSIKNIQAIIMGLQKINVNSSGSVIPAITAVNVDGIN